MKRRKVRARRRVPVPSVRETVALVVIGALAVAGLFAMGISLSGVLA
jgi:hypothetical protein